MALNDEKKRKRKHLKVIDEEDTETGGTDTGETGAGGAIEFREFIQSNESLRDDQLSAQEIRRLLLVHAGQHEGVVQKQKSVRDNRKQLKEGKISLAAHREGLKNGSQGQYKNHPILSNKAQFSGDRQVNSLPNENIADTNQEKRDELQYRYALQHRPNNVPQFNPQLTRK